jgi:hypothetical protein
MFVATQQCELYPKLDSLSALADSLSNSFKGSASLKDRIAAFNPYLPVPHRFTKIKDILCQNE